MITSPPGYEQNNGIGNARGSPYMKKAISIEPIRPNINKTKIVSALKRFGVKSVDA